MNILDTINCICIKGDRMTSNRIIKYNKKYELIEPLDNFSHSYGYCMIVNYKGEVLKFYRIGAVHNAIKYFDYISLSLWGKLKYWLHYKRE